MTHYERLSWVKEVKLLIESGGGSFPGDIATVYRAFPETGIEVQALYAHTSVEEIKV